MACGLHVQGQDMSSILKANPLDELANRLGATEHFPSESASVKYRASGAVYEERHAVSQRQHIQPDFGRGGACGAIVVPEFRYYFSGEAPDGMYIAPFGRWFGDHDPQQRWGNSQTRGHRGWICPWLPSVSLANGSNWRGVSWTSIQVLQDDLDRGL